MAETGQVPTENSAGFAGFEYALTNTTFLFLCTNRAKQYLAMLKIRHKSTFFQYGSEFLLKLWKRDPDPHK